MKLLLTALSKVPPVSQVVYRGAIGDLSNIYPTGRRFAWWGFSSCTAKSEVLEQFLDSAGKRTIFNIECDTGKDIRRHSENEKEEEVLLLPGRQFQVVSCVRAGTDFHIIQLKEVSSTASVVPLPPWPEAIRHIKLDMSRRQFTDLDLEGVIKQTIIMRQCVKLNLARNEITHQGASLIAGELRRNTVGGFYIFVFLVSIAILLDSDALPPKSLRERNTSERSTLSERCFIAEQSKTIRSFHLHASLL
jgi:hypothetical protein